MDPRGDPSVLPYGPSSMSSPPPATVRRRLSMDEDFLYQRLMTDHPRRPSRPPPYEVEPSKSKLRDGKKKTETESRGKASGLNDIPEGTEMLPSYSSSIELEGIFMKKHEIEDTTKRAEDRRWHTTFVTLTGTALNLYAVKKNRSWGRTVKDGPGISPDNPPWLRRGKLEKSYSLLYADAGIAADYKKRRYVIRVRAETDQFLLSCIELSTFNKWLEGLFAAIDVALPIEDRDFPRDMSIPRMQRVRWFRGMSPTRQEYSLPTTEQLEETGESPNPDIRRRSSSPEALSTLYQRGSEPHHLSPGMDEPDGEAEVGVSSQAVAVFDDDEGQEDGQDEGSTNHESTVPPRLDPAHRLSTSSYPNVGINPHSGKWFPEHRWSSAHDLLYAKLCYSNLLFRSPRKSNYIIKDGRKWYVDWSTGRMVRVLPPEYGEVFDFMGPWQAVHTENMRI